MKRLLSSLYFQVLAAIVVGVVLGLVAPDLAVPLKPLGDGFIKLIKMLIAPIIFTTVVVGIAGMGDIKKVGRVGVKALIYFEVVTTAALVIGLVVPAGYSFNPDGTCIYLTMAALFIAQAPDTGLSLASQLGLLGVLLITSKGAAGVTGSGFIVLAATRAATGKVPVAGMALILGVDRFMSEARAITNFIGNAVATLVVARWDGEFDASAVGSVPRTAPTALNGISGIIQASFILLT